jgi:hypothetical protein
VDIVTRVFHGTVVFFVVGNLKSYPDFTLRIIIEIFGNGANYKDNSLSIETVAYLIIF